MDIKTLTADLSVSPQIMPADLSAIRDAGFRAIICNRPDGEGADQPSFDEVSVAARALGLEAAYQPIVVGKVSDQDAATFGANLADLPGPALAYCRTGTRSAMLWSLLQAAECSR